MTFSMSVCGLLCECVWSVVILWGFVMLFVRSVFVLLSSVFCGHVMPSVCTVLPTVLSVCGIWGLGLGGFFHLF